MPIYAPTPVVATNVAVRDRYESLNRVRKRIRRAVGEVSLIMIQKHRLRILTASVHQLPVRNAAVASAGDP